MNRTKSIELKEAIEKYIKWKRRNISTAETRYLSALNNLKAYLGNCLLHEVSGDDIVQYDEFLENAGYSASTRALNLRIIRNFIVFWDGRGQVNFSPKEIIPPQPDTPRQVVVEEEEFEQMCAILNPENIFDLQKLVAIRLLWETGMRVSELVNLRLEDLVRGSNSIWVARVLSCKKKGQDKYDLVAWGTTTNSLLQEYVAHRLTTDISPVYVFKSLSRNQSREQITERSLQRWIRELAERALITKKITPHSFRHGKGHQILSKGGDLIDVQKILRHKNINSTLHYTRLNPSKYLTRASRFIENDENIKIPIEFVESEPEAVIPKVVFKSKAVYNSI